MDNSGASRTDCTFGATGTGGGQIDYPVSYQTRIVPIGLSLTSSNTVANTTTPTTLVGKVFAGRSTIAADAMLPYGNGAKTVKIYAAGIVGTNSTNFALTITISLGGNTLSTITVPTVASMSSAGWQLDYYFTVNGMTGANVGGCVNLTGTSNAALISCASNSGVTGIAWGTDQVLDVKATWTTANAANTITVNQLTAYQVQGL